MIGHKLIPSRNGGVEVVVTHLGPHLVELGYTVTCYNRTNSECREARKMGRLENTYRGVRLIWTPTINRRGLAAMSSSILASVMAAFGTYDLVHYHTEGPCVLCWLPRLMGKKVVVTVHGLDHQRQKWGKLVSAYIMQGEKAAVCHAHRIIVLSKGVQTYFLDRYRRQTDLIPNGIDPAKPKAASEIKKSLVCCQGNISCFSDVWCRKKVFIPSLRLTSPSKRIKNWSLPAAHWIPMNM